MGDVIPAVYSEDTDVYNLPTGVDFLSSSNLLKMAVPDIFHRPINSPYATAQLLHTQSGQASSRLATWDANPAANFAESTLNEGDGHAIWGSNYPSSSFLLGGNEADVSMQSYIMRNNGLTGSNDPATTSAHNMSSLADRSSYMIHSLTPALSPPRSLQQPFFHSHDLGQNHAWGHEGTELLLLPGSTEAAALGRSPPPSDDFHTRVYVSSYGGRSQSSLPAREGPPTQSRRHAQALSLSLSSQHHNHSNRHSLDMRISASGAVGIIRSSKYLKPTQQLLDEFCSVVRSLKMKAAKPHLAITELAQLAPMNHSHTRIASAIVQEAMGATVDMAVEGGGSAVCSNQLPLSDASTDTASAPTSMLMPKPLHPDQRIQLQAKKDRLVALIEEVDKAYREYEEHLQMVTTSLESATGLGSATPYTALARQAMSRHFRSLRDAMGKQILAVCQALGEEPSRVAVLCRGETPRLRILEQQMRHHRAVQQTGLLLQQPWRPHRGLPERSVSILRAWLFEHFLDPYPKDTEKLMLARQAGLTRGQVSNWFINARVRLWKPMIEAMYCEEAKEGEEPAGAGNEERSSEERRTQAGDGASCDHTSGPNSSGASSDYDPAEAMPNDAVGEELHSYGHVGGEELHSYGHVGREELHSYGHVVREKLHSYGHVGGEELHSYGHVGGSSRQGMAAGSTASKKGPAIEGSLGHVQSVVSGSKHGVGATGVTLTLGLQQSSSRDTYGGHGHHLQYHNPQQRHGCRCEGSVMHGSCDGGSGFCMEHRGW